MKLPGLPAFLVFVLLTSLLCSSWISAQQENEPEQQQQKETVDHILDAGQSITLFQSRGRAEQESIDFMQSIGFGFVKIFNELDSFDTDQPAACYEGADWDMEVFQLPDDRESIITVAIDPDSITDWSEPFRVESPTELFPGFLSSSRFGSETPAIIRNGSFFFGYEELLEEIRNAKPIRESLGPQFVELINKHTAVFFHRFIEGEGIPGGFDDWHFAGEMPEEETEFLQQVKTTIDSGKHFATGVSFDNGPGDLIVESLLSFNENKAYEKLLNLEAINKPLTPTLGLPVENLLLSVSFQVEVLGSPVAMRMVPQIVNQLIPVWGLPEEQFVGGRMVRTVFELLSDSWHELSSLRLAMYEVQSDEAEANGASGELCLIGVMDANEGDQFKEHFKRLALVAGIQVEGVANDEQRAEIAALIEQLDDRKFLVRQRASNQLMLAGRNALPQLEAAAETGSPERKGRIRQILGEWQLDAEQAIAEMSVDEASFWMRLRPEFSVQDSDETFGGESAQIVQIHPDAELAPEKLAHATRTMRALFGDDWERIQLVRVGDRFVFMLGSDQQLLERVVRNVAEEADPIAAMQVVHNKQIPPGHFQIHASMARLSNMFIEPYYDWTTRHEVFDNELTTVKLRFDESVWSGSLVLPIEEVRPLFEYFSH